MNQYQQEYLNNNKTYYNRGFAFAVAADNIWTWQPSPGDPSKDELIASGTDAQRNQDMIGRYKMDILNSTLVREMNMNKVFYTFHRWVQQTVPNRDERPIAAAGCIFTFYYLNFKMVTGVSADSITERLNCHRLANPTKLFLVELFRKNRTVNDVEIVLGFFTSAKLHRAFAKLVESIQLRYDSQCPVLCSGYIFDMYRAFCL